MTKLSTHDIAQVGALSALGAAAILIFHIPGPGGSGYFHMGETVMLTAAMLLGRRKGAMIGALSGCIADLIVGFPMWAPFSFVIHGAECWLAASLSDGRCGLRDAVAIAIASAVMAAGYTLSSGLLYGAATMPAELTVNLFQGGFGLISSFLLCKLATSVPYFARRRADK